MLSCQNTRRVQARLKRYDRHHGCQEEELDPHFNDPFLLVGKQDDIRRVAWLYLCRRGRGALDEYCCVPLHWHIDAYSAGVDVVCRASDILVWTLKKLVC